MVSRLRPDGLSAGILLHDRTQEQDRFDISNNITIVARFVKGHLIPADYRSHHQILKNADDHELTASVETHLERLVCMYFVFCRGTEKVTVVG